MTGATLLVAAPPARRARDRPLDGALHRRRELRRLRDVVRTVGSGGETSLQSQLGFVRACQWVSFVHFNYKAKS